MTLSRALVRINDGEFTLVDPTDRNISQIRWTAYQGGGITTNRGESIFDPALGKKTALSDEPEYGEITIKTAYSNQYAVTIRRWVAARAKATDIVGIGTRAGLRYDVKGCSFVGASGLEPNFDKNGSGSSAGFIELRLKPTEVTLAQ